MIPLGSGDETELTIDFFDFFVFIYEHIHQINLAFLLLTLSMFLYVKKILKKFGSFILRKIKISYPLVRTSTCAYQGVRNVSFSEHLRIARTKLIIPNDKFIV